jgi:hypothetical protein
MGTTDYRSTFIEVAADCPVTTAEEPPEGARGPSVARLQFELVRERPYALTSDDVLFEVHARRAGVPEAERAAARERFFARSQACLRASPLAKRYGWGVHSDAEGRVALVPLGSADYARLAADPAVAHLRAMRSTRA